MKRLLDFLKPSLLSRVALALGLVGLVPVTFLASRLVGINRGAMETQVELTQTRTATTVAERIGYDIETLLSLGNSLTGNPTLNNPASTATQELLHYSQAGFARAGVLGVALVNPAGELFILAQSPDEDSRRRVRQMLELPFDELVEMSVDNPPGTDANDKVDSAQMVVTLRVAAPLSEQRGFVWLIFDGNLIRDAVLKPEQVQQEATITLAHQEGFALLGSLDEYPQQILETVLNPNVEGNMARVETDDGAELVAHASVHNTRWIILSRQPVKVAHKVAEEMERESWLAVVLVAIGVVLLSTLAYQTTVKPIRELAAAQRRLAGVSSLGEGSEIEQLKASFDALEERLKDRSALDEVFLGRYQVRDVIGSGAMGTVFLGYDPKLQRPVALKTIKLDQKLGQEKREELLGRLLHEAVTTAKFSHGNIVAIFDVEDRGGSAFMAMEYVDGDSLEGLVWRIDKLAPGPVAVLGAAIARALAAAHSHDLVHRDVKPANILLGTDGSIKVTDFGIAELLSSMSDREDVVFGTPGYLPPETLQGKGYDASGDLFSLGAVLYFALTGYRPFEGKTVKEVIRKTLFSTVSPPSKQVPGIPPDLEALVLSLLSSERKRRPADAAAVAERLEKIVRDLDARWEPPAEDLESVDGAATAPVAAYLPTTRLEA